MFTLREAVRGLTHNRSRSILLLLCAALLCVCMAFYLGNIRANEEALERFAVAAPVKVWVASGNGERSSPINIMEQQMEALAENWYLKDLQATALAATALSEEARAQEPFAGGDGKITAVSGMEALRALGLECSFASGYDASVLAGDQPLCVMDQAVMERLGLGLGEEITAPVYLIRLGLGGIMEFTPIGEQALTLAGSCAGESGSQTLYVPIRWLRQASQAAGAELTYSSCGAVLKDPRQLNRFKATVESMGFLDVDPESYDEFNGAALLVDDGDFIAAAERLGKNITSFRRFLFPFFGLVTGLVMLVIFLILRGSRRDMAIAVSLGRPKVLTALSSFLWALAGEAVGCLLALPVILLGAGLSFAGGLAVCGGFLLCAAVGNALGLLLLLRFDVMALLIAAE